MAVKNNRSLVLLELILLFVVLPLLYVCDLIPVHKIIPLLLLFAYCGCILLVDKPINSKRWSIRADWKLILVRFSILGALILMVLYFFSSSPLIANFQENKKLLFMVLMYPFLSAFPQELIFREFFYYRYKILFQHPTILLSMNVVLFAFAHVYFTNWLVMAFTLIGGVIFSITYLKTKSLLVATIEHTLYGLLILSSGLSGQFYKAF
jgi:uncharacterized protein